MARMGHDSVETAPIYQYATSAADQAVTSKLNDRIRRERAGDDDPDDGPAGAGRAWRRTCVDNASAFGRVYLVGYQCAR
jgi:hypothetical protein